MVSSIKKQLYGLAILLLGLCISFALPAEMNPDFTAYHRIFNNYGADFQTWDGFAFGLLTGTVRLWTNSYQVYKLCLASLFAIVLMIATARVWLQPSNAQPYLLTLLLSAAKQPIVVQVALVLFATVLSLSLLAWFELNAAITLRSGLSGLFALLLVITLNRNWRFANERGNVLESLEPWLLLLISLLFHKASLFITGPYLYCCWRLQGQRFRSMAVLNCLLVIAASIMLFTWGNAVTRSDYHSALHPLRLLLYLAGSTAGLLLLADSITSTTKTLEPQLLAVWFACSVLAVYGMLYLLTWPFQSVVQSSGEAMARLTQWLCFLVMPALLSASKTQSLPASLIIISINALVFKALFLQG